MGSFLIWYLWVTAAGLIGFPITFRLLRHLPDRGYALARVFALLVWGYLFWMMAVLGVAQNDLGGVILAFALLLGASLYSLKGQWEDIRTYFIQNWRMVAGVELVFLVFFAFWAIVRAANPALIGTEKPMELAFINSILKSPGFPPGDPWLSGYAISYYYFGYVIVSILIRVTGVSSTVGFNLMIALLFGLVAVSAYGVLNNLLHLHRKSDDPIGKRFNLQALLAPIFVLLVSNLGGLMEMLHARGVGWKAVPDGSLASHFWTWLAIPEWSQPPKTPFGWVPNRAGYGYWWWRSSRVVQDFRMNGDWVEIIDEFPHFSYILADMHPHVLAMPFVLLAVGVILNIYLAGVNSAENRISVLEWARMKLTPVRNLTDLPGKPSLFIGHWLREPVFWMAVLVTGGIAFMNTWDFPIYVGLLALAVTLRQYQMYGWSIRRLVEFLETGLLAGILSVLLYIPYYAGFGSQAGGFLPSLGFFTKGVYFWIMFGTLLIPQLVFLIWQSTGKRTGFRIGPAWKITAVLVLGGWLFSYLYALLFFIASALFASDKINQFIWLILNVQRSSSHQELLVGSLVDRLESPVTILTIGLLFTLVWGLLAGQFNQKVDVKVKNMDRTRSMGFFLLLVLLGAGLVFVPEFIYLRDQFGTRMNTIFKFYYQAWILWGIAASYAIVVLWHEAKSGWAIAARLVTAVTLLAGLIYPVFAIWETTKGFSPIRYDENQEQVTDWTLDGAAYRYRNDPDEMAAIDWLRDAPYGVVAEAVGGSYSEYARVSTYSGQPAVLGWPGHESQWRGSENEKGTRESDMETLFRSKTWEDVQMILERYDIRYVFWGSLERYAYNAATNVFDQYLIPVYQGSGTIIYEYQP
ncbi:MAG: hypothetical protein HPY85_05425 [Anaerolineae bacterium]|nr:hypothetical protein [Anaerolineae bacterium]